MTTATNERLDTAHAILPRGNVVLSLQGKLVGRGTPSAHHDGRLLPDAAHQTDAASIGSVDSAVELRSELDRQRAELATLNAKVAESEVIAFNKGFAEGQIAGKASAADTLRKSEESIAKAVADSLVGLERTFARVESLAAAIALTAIEQIIGDDATMADRVRVIVGRQLSQFRDAMPLEVRVAATDFPDNESLRSSLNGAGHDSVDLVVDPNLESGGCRIRLRLGEVDVGVRQQLNALRNVLTPDDDR